MDVDCKNGSDSSDLSDKGDEDCGDGDDDDDGSDRCDATDATDDDDRAQSDTQHNDATKHLPDNVCALVCELIHSTDMLNSIADLMSGSQS